MNMNTQPSTPLQKLHEPLGVTSQKVASCVVTVSQFDEKCTLTGTAFWFASGASGASVFEFASDSESSHSSGSNESIDSSSMLHGAIHSEEPARLASFEEAPAPQEDLSALVQEDLNRW